MGCGESKWSTCKGIFEMQVLCGGKRPKNFFVDEALLIRLQVNALTRHVSVIRVVGQ
jgi:hypothetical protein